jgi:hypothetical protein
MRIILAEFNLVGDPQVAAAFKTVTGFYVSGGIPDQSFCRQGCEEPRERADKNRRAKPGGDAGQPPNTIVNNSVSTIANSQSTS